MFGPAGVGDILWTPASAAAGAGRLSSVWDRGAGHVPSLHRWYATARWIATPAANDRWSLWLVQADALATPSRTDAGLTLGDAALTTESELIANCGPLGTVLATAIDRLFVSSGVVDLWSRFVAIAGWNGSTTKALVATAADIVCSFQPIPFALEAPA
jgi:hypothetical protein